MAAAKADFEVATFRGRLKLELVGLGVATAFIMVRGIATLSDSFRSNWVPAVVILGCLVVHFATMRWRNAFWGSVVAMLFDCVMLAAGHPTVQCAFWSQIYAPLHLGNIPDRDIGREDFAFMGYNSLLHGFLSFFWLSFYVEFTYLAKHAVVGIPAGLVCYFVPVFLSRSVLDSEYGLLETWSHSVFEVLLLTLSMVKVLISKTISERHARESFELMVSKQNEVIMERTLRCQAEFSMEMLKGPVVGGKKGNDGSDLSYLRHACAEHEGGQPEVPPKAPASSVSQHSAPADMLPETLQRFLRDARACQDSVGLGNDCGGNSGGMDCFPVDAMVWADGHSTPTAVSEVVPGQRVLCFDSLMGSVKYAAISSVKLDSEAVEWAEVALVDGTKLTMTSDHPVHPASAIGHSLSHRVVPAAELSPMSDRVMVHKIVTVPVTVASVSRRSAAESDMRDRVSLEICQPGRHHVLVAAPGQNLDIRSLAVASVSQGGRSTSVKKGFIHIPVCEEESGFRGVRRAMSEPPLERHALADGEGPAAPTSPPRPASNSNHSSPASLHSVESLSVDGGPDLVTIPDTDPRGQHDRSFAGVRLGHMLNARRAGLASVGSSRHAAGFCVPCQLAFRGMCRSGMTCQYCHEEHSMRRVKGKKMLFSDRQLAMASGGARPS